MAEVITEPTELKPSHMMRAALAVTADLSSTLPNVGALEFDVVKLEHIHDLVEELHAALDELIIEVRT